VGKPNLPSKSTQTERRTETHVQTETIMSAGTNTDESLLHKMAGGKMEELEQARRAKKQTRVQASEEIAVQTTPEEGAMVQQLENWKIDSILRGRMSAWIVDNTRLRAASSGLGLRKSPSMHAKDGLNCAPWGAIVEGVIFNEDWLEIMTVNGVRFLPRTIQDKPVIRAYDSKETYDAMLEEAEAARREAEIIEEETLKVLADLNPKGDNQIENGRTG